MNTEKQEIFDKVAAMLGDNGIAYAETNFTKPWGGYFVVDTEDGTSVGAFLKAFYPELEATLTQNDLPLSPKILCVAPEMRLSWQYHYRRSEYWKLVDGVAGYVKSLTDEQTELKEMEMFETLVLGQGERHRLVGLNDWGIIAEIWQHTDATNPSNEEDIVRLADDFGR